MKKIKYILMSILITFTLPQMFAESATANDTKWVACCGKDPEEEAANRMTKSHRSAW
jgi:hypothetical protein